MKALKEFAEKLNGRQYRNELTKELETYAKENGIAAALEKYSNITDAADVAVISKFYDMLVNKASFTEICEELATLKFKEH